MLVSQKVAIAAHMHVLLRRKTGRVTDTEWMAENLEYAVEIVRFARAKGLEDGHADLIEWAEKLERAALDASAAPGKPLVQSALQALREKAHEAKPVAPAKPAKPATPVTERTGGFQSSGFRPSAPSFEDSLLDAEKSGRREPPSGPRYVGGIR